MAMFSKGFAWLSGSPADNEKLSVGKTAQFFGFVAVRYASDRIERSVENWVALFMSSRHPRNVKSCLRLPRKRLSF